MLHANHTREPSLLPPGGLAPHQVPLFVSFGFDDNGLSGLRGSGGGGGLSWVLDQFASLRNPGLWAGAPEKARATFYMKTANLEAPYDEAPYIRECVVRALREGHEVGSHSHSHPHGVDVDWVKGTRRPLMDQAAWEAEIRRSVEVLEALAAEAGLPAPGPGEHPLVRGFRCPYLNYSSASFRAAAAQGLAYDSSVEEGWEAPCSALQSHWPGTLGRPHPGEAWVAETLFRMESQSGGYPRLWELPIPCLHLPPDDLCRYYGVAPGFRQRMKDRVPYYNPQKGTMTGLDWNMWFEMFMTAEEALATWKYSLDTRLAGNRAPLLFGGHTDIYADRYEVVEGSGETGNVHLWRATAQDRRDALGEMIRYAASRPGVMVVRMDQVLDWCRDPQPMAR